MAASRTTGTADRLPATTLERRAPARWNEASPATRTAAGRGLGADDGIVILESDSRAARPGTGGASSAAAAAKGRARPARRASRGRSTTGPSPSKPVEPGRPRALTSLVTQSMAQKRNGPSRSLRSPPAGTDQFSPDPAHDRGQDRTPRLARFASRLHRRITAIHARKPDQAARGRSPHRIAPAAPGVAPAGSAAINGRLAPDIVVRRVVGQVPILTTSDRPLHESSIKLCARLGRSPTSENSTSSSIANGLARSKCPGGISTEGVRNVLLRTFNSDITRQSS